jgi:hypothetical protein
LAKNGKIVLRAADRYAYRLWKHCLFCRDCLERRDIYILLAFALLCWRRPVSPHRRSPRRLTGDHPVDHAQLPRLAPERGLFATDSRANIRNEVLEGLILDDLKSHMHTHNPAYQKIPETVSLHVGNQGFISYVADLLDDGLRWGIDLLALAIRFGLTVAGNEMLACMVGSAIHRDHLPIIGALPAFLRVVAGKKT